MTPSTSMSGPMNDSHEIAADALSLEMEADSAVVLVDIREALERLAGHIEPSFHIPPDNLTDGVRNEFPDDRTSLVLYCARGIRSREAARTLHHEGYSRVRFLAGGIEAWYAAGHPMQSDAATRGREWAPRYARQLRIPEVGPEGQKKLLDASVLILGAGGLGAPAAYYLTAAGVGTLGLVDSDRVDESNLHRQILYRTSDVGTPKVFTAQATLQALNPDVRIVPFHERFTRENAERIARDFDIILDGTDNFAARYLVNDICIKLNKPNVHGSIHRFEGQVAVFCHGDGPCYRCLYPEPPPAGWAPTCAEAGVLGLLPGVIGSLQASEAAKLILGIGEILSGRLLRFDALSATFDSFTVARRPECDWCDPDTPFPGLVDYQELCGDA